MPELSELITDRDEFPCSSCGSVLRYEPGQDSLVCHHCGFSNLIEKDPGAELKENDLWATLNDLAGKHEEEVVHALSCQACAATFTSAPGSSSETCPFCGTAVVINPYELRQLKPDGILPFAIPKDQAQAAGEKWRRGLFFAPGKFKNFGRDEHGLKGMYLPFWTFDAQTDNRYTGQRGINYTTTVGSGKNRRTVVRTRWWPVSGRIKHFFDDVLIWAGRNVPAAIIKRFQARWNLSDMVPYDPQYLVGMEAQAYDLTLQGGHTQAKEEIRERVRALVRRDIGGDKQRINTLDIKYSDETFKLALLPIWISALQYRGETYTFIVNGRTGEVRGERPLSWLKVTLVTLAGLLLAGLVAAVFLAAEGG